MLVLCTPLIYFVGPRLPTRSKAADRPRVSYKFVTSRTFIFFQLASMLESLGYSLPSIFLPSYARSIGLSPVSGTLVLALLNASSILGAVSTGYLSDRLHVTTVIAISTAGSTLSIFLFWGPATNLPLLALFAITYGTFAGGFSAVWSAMIREVRSENCEAKLGMLGLFSGGRGVCCAVSGPLAGALLKGAPFKGEWVLGYGTGYGPLMLFTGVSALLGLVCFGAKRSKAIGSDSG
jgi:MFS family permease